MFEVTAFEVSLTKPLLFFVSDYNKRKHPLTEQTKNLRSYVITKLI